MACPQTTDCIAKTTVVIGPFIFTQDDFMEGGVIWTKGSEEKPNLSVQRSHSGKVTSINRSGYVKAEPSLRLNPCNATYKAMRQAWIEGQDCFDTIVINNPCCIAPQVYTDVIIKSMTPADTSVDDTESTVDFEAKVIS